MLTVMGGNAFLLMRAIRYSGFDDVVRKMLAGDEIAYQEIEWKGIGLVDRCRIYASSTTDPAITMADGDVYFMADGRQSLL